MDARLLLGLHVGVVAPCQDLPLLEFARQRLCILLGEDVDDPCWGDETQTVEHNHVNFSGIESSKEVTICQKLT